MEPYDLMKVVLIVRKMKENSEAWQSAGPEERMELEQKNQALGRRLNDRHGIPAVYCDADGMWYVGQVGAARLYDLY